MAPRRLLEHMETESFQESSMVSLRSELMSVQSDINSSKTVENPDMLLAAEQVIRVSAEAPVKR